MKLVHFFADLVKSPTMQEMLKRDPDAVMDAAGLSDEEKEVLKSGDKLRIAAVVANQVSSSPLWFGGGSGGAEDSA
jgi:hypothetical protein